MSNKDLLDGSLPDCVTGYIRRVVLRMGYSRKVRAEVRQELTDHFIDALADCSDQDERRSRAEQLIAQFGDAKLLARLIRRGKKRCRPLWKKVIIRTAQSFGAFILLFIGYSAWFFTGQATLSTDYLAHLNQMVRPDVSNSQNAWPLYEKAMELCKEPTEEVKEILKETPFWYWEQKAFFWYWEQKALAGLTAEQQRLISQWIEQNQPAWEKFTAASQMPYCWPEYKRGEQNEQYFVLLNMALPELGKMRSLARCGIWQAGRSLDQNEPEKAIQQYLTIVRAGRHLQGKAIIIEQLVGLAIGALGHRQIKYLALEQDLSKEQLAYIQAQLEEIYVEGYPLMDMEPDRLMMMDTIQNLFTQGGPGGGHLIPRRYIEFINFCSNSGNEQEDDWNDEFEMVLYSANCFVHASRNETVAEVNKLYRRLAEVGRMSPYQRHSLNIESFDTYLNALSEYRQTIIRKLMPALDRASELAFRGEAEYEATLCILALRRWELDKGQYPKSLGELVSGGYLEQVPDDPYSDSIFCYQRRGDDFVLYSVGANFIDDKGVAYPGVNRWEPERGDSAVPGDHVFWPLISR